MDVAIITPRSRGSLRVFEYLVSGADSSADASLYLLTPEIARTVNLEDFNVVVLGDPALASVAGDAADVVVVHDIGPHRSPQLFESLYVPPTCDRDDVTKLFDRCEVVTFSSTTALLLDELIGVDSVVIKPGVDVDYWANKAGSAKIRCDVGAIVPVTEPMAKGLPFIAECKSCGLDVALVTSGSNSLPDNWVTSHLVASADVVVISPDDSDLAKILTDVWIAPGFEGFGLAPLEMHAANGTIPVWTYCEDLGYDSAKPKEFQVRRSPEGVDEVIKIIEKRPKFPLSEYTSEAFFERFYNEVLGSVY